MFYQDGGQIRPSPSREFRAADNLIVFFQIYNAETHKETGKPLVRVTVRLMKDNQAARPPIDYVLTETTAQPSPRLTFARFIKLAGLPPGRYAALIETRDMATNRAVTRESPFVITQ